MSYWEDHSELVKKCKFEGCAQNIIWMKSKNTGKMVPVNAASIPEDTNELIFDKDKGMIAHFATCPAANTFRRPREERKAYRDN